MYYFFRHPETTWNNEGRMQGSKEGSITAKAKLEALEQVKSLPLKSVRNIYYAGNKRTKYLADLIKKKYPEAVLIKDIRLNERNCGVYEGVPLSEIFSEDENVTNYKKRYYWKPPMGESHAEVSKRVKDFVKFLKRKEDSQYSVCVTSSGVIRNLVRVVKKLSLEKMYSLKIRNLDCFELDFN